MKSQVFHKFTKMLLTPNGLVIVLPNGKEAAIAGAMEIQTAKASRKAKSAKPAKEPKAVKANGRKSYVRLTPEQRTEIKTLYKSGKSGGYRDLAAKFGVSMGTVRNVVVG